MRWASSVAEGESLDAIVETAALGVTEGLDHRTPDLVVAFISPHFADELDRVPGLVRGMLGGGLLLGCSAGGVIGGGSEVEERPAFSLTAASLPGVDLRPFHLDGRALPEPRDHTAWETAVRCVARDDASFLLLPDPFSCDSDRLLRGLDSSFPGASKIGGLASGARSVGGNRLYLGPNSYSTGVVGVALAGNIAVESVVAQGCRPVGEPMFVTGCRENVVLELDGKPPLEVLRDLYESLPAEDREIFRHSLFLGVVMNERRDRYAQGDFLIRNLGGVAEESRGLVVGASLAENQVVQFHLRDRRTSAEDLDSMLARYAEIASLRPPMGSLLFSCLGRGARLYGEANHDSGVFRRHLGDVPLGGFFCNGEIGQVQGRTFLHGYTSAFGMFRPHADA
jgi:small ligand-binding sensory domain FIST